MCTSGEGEDPTVKERPHGTGFIVGDGKTIVRSDGNTKVVGPTAPESAPPVPLKSHPRKHTRLSSKLNSTYCNSVESFYSSLRKKEEIRELACYETGVGEEENRAPLCQLPHSCV